MRRDRPRRVRRRASAPRRRERHPARGPRARRLRRLPRRARPLGAPLDGRRGGRRRRVWRGRASRRLRRSASSCARRDCARRRSWRRSHAPAGTPTRVRDRLDRARELLRTARGAAAEASAITPNAAGWLALAEAEYERARGDARPDALVGRRGDLGAPRTPAPRGVLPLARGRGARRGRCVPHRGGAFRCGQAHAVAARHRREAAAAGARAAGPARAARSRAAGERVTSARAAWRRLSA